MSIAKVIELTARSDKSFDDAIRTGLAKAGETVRGIREAWVQGQKVLVEGDVVVGYQVDLKVTFLVD
jgi:flavin-binding protein dodecin